MERIKINIQRFANDEVTVKLTATVDELQKALSKAKSSLNGLSKEISATNKETYSLKDAAKEVGTAFKSVNVSAITNQIKRLGKSLYNDFLTKAIDTSEELNLFNVVFDNMQKNGQKTFSELGKQANSFQKRLNEAFGTNMKETMRYQGLFQAMGESAGLDDKTAALMSENMTKLAYDLASLYNTTETKAAESLRAGVYAGQTKPLRNYGIDVTQTSFKPLMQELGLEKSVNELTQAEKEILRYITTLKQAKNAMGDFANTIESPANQLKVLRQQFYEMQAAIGNLFIGAFARILPYVNGIIMAIKAVAQAIAGFFGIELQDYNSGLAYYEEGLEDYADGLDGVGSSAGGASKAIEKLKRQTLAFDQINNLTTPTPSSGSGGGGGGGVGGLAGAIDERLLEAIKGYENGMDKVKMKATEIRDKIMEILGFTRDINGEWEWGGFSKLVKNFKSWFGDLDFKGKTIAVVGMLTAFTALFNVLKGFGKLTGVTSLFKTIGKVGGKLIGAGGTTAAAGTAAAGSSSAAGGTAAATTSGIASAAAPAAIAIGEMALALFDVAAGAKAASSQFDTLLNKNEPKRWQEIGSEIYHWYTLLLDPTGFNRFFEIVGNIMGGFKQAIQPLSANDILDLSGVSEKTKKTLGQVLKDYMQFTDNLNMMSKLNRQMFADEGLTQFVGIQISQAQVDELKRLFNDATQITVKALEEQKQVALTGVDSMKTSLGDKYDEIRSKIEGTYNGQIEDANNAYNRISEIVDNAMKRDGILTKEEMDEINKIRQSAQDDAIKHLTDSEAEMLSIRQTMKERATTLNAQQAAAIIKKSAELRDATVKNAEDQYTQIMIQAEKMHAVGDLTDDEYEQMRNAAWDTYTKTVEAAQQQHQDVYNEFAAQNEDIAKYIDADTGNIKSYWQAFWDSLWGKTKKDYESDKKPKLKKMGSDSVDAVKQGIASSKTPEVKVESKFPSKLEVQNQANQLGNGITCPIKITADLAGFKQTITTAITGTKLKVKTSNDGWVTISKAATGGIFANGSWQPIQAYANGGLPSGGQLFMAREAGPELVGKIGKHTAVMNNNQIVDSVKAGVYEAVSAAMGNGIGSVEIVAHTDEGVVIDRINKITRQTGNCPIDF